MKIKNPNNLPEALVNAAIGDSDYSPSPNRMSVTDLIASPWQRYLKLQHYAELESDVEDMTWLLMGKAFHMLMDHYSPEGAISETKIELPYGDITIVGIPDVHKGGVLYDYKVTSVYSFLLGAKKEWEQQLNIYVYMLKSKGIDINKLQIIAILKDHMARKANEHDYPSKPMIAVDIPLWDLGYTKEFIDERMKAHKELIPCTPEERWMKPDTFAVKAPYIKTAKRVLNSMEEAEAWLAANPKGSDKWFIEKRKGEDSKCLLYCSYAKWCAHNRYNSESEIEKEDK